MKISNREPAFYLCPYSAAVTINENADPNVLRDLGCVGEIDSGGYGIPSCEGNSDSHLNPLSLGVPSNVIVENGEPQLVVWQALYFCEFDGPGPGNSGCSFREINHSTL
jgi:secondary thiamine-phosphate synthase enzyme